MFKFIFEHVNIICFRNKAWVYTWFRTQLTNPNKPHTHGIIVIIDKPLNYVSIRLYTTQIHLVYVEIPNLTFILNSIIQYREIRPVRLFSLLFSSTKYYGFYVFFCEQSSSVFHREMNFRCVIKRTLLLQ